MTVAFPEGSISVLEQDSSAAPLAAESGVGAGSLLALAAAYHLAQTRLSRNAERSAAALLRSQRPLTDAQMTAWMASWNALLGGQAASQAQLTAAYARTQMSRFGVSVPVTLTVPSPAPDGIDGWLAGPYARIAPPSLLADVRRARAVMDSGTLPASQAALVDRVQFLHSPVVKQRWRVSEGETFDAALSSNGRFVSSATYDAGRAVERIVMGAQSWPAFRNGTAMMYRRVPQAGACGWCRLVATRLYSLASFRATGGGQSAPWHGACRCAWAAVTLSDATSYANALAENGDYFDAASRIGLWSGDRPSNYRDLEREKAVADGSSAPVPRPVEVSAAQQQATARAAAARVSAEASAQRLVADANALNAQARAAFAAGDSARATALYGQASALTSQALRLRTGR